MLRPRLVRGLALSSLVVLVASCGESPIPSEPDATPLAARGQAGPADLPSADDLDARIPGFGGFFVDADGSPTVYLTRGSARGPAEQALAAQLGGRGAGALKVREAKYSWGQLQRWQVRATEVALDGPGAVWVDNDETANRIRIGVEDLNGMGRVRGALAAAGFPDDAVIIERAAPILQVATLRDVSTRPVMAGVQIHFGNFVCSIGFNANDGAARSFVTASHCTNKQGGVEGTAYYQPLSSVNGTVLATEVEDPPYVRNGPGCPRGRQCRYSDAARAAYANAADQDLGAIAKTSGANNGSLTITGEFTINANDCSTTGGCLSVGTTVNKVGRTTGWTAGNISNTCVNTGVSGTNIVQLCQTFVNAGVGGGDSGSDVYQITGGTVKLVGVLWGGNGAGTQFVFSPFGNVVRELGTLTTF